MEQERNVTQFQQDKPPACVPCFPKHALCPAWLCHPHATLAFSSQTAQLVSVGFSLIIPVSVLFLAVATGPSCLCPTLGYTPHSLVPRAQRLEAAWLPRGSAGRPSPEDTARQRWLRGPFGCPALVRHLQPCAHTRFPALAPPCQ